VQDSTSMPEQSKFSVEDARRLFDATPFVGWWGLTVDDLGDGWATVGLPFREQLTRPGGIDADLQLVAQSSLTYVRA
jgi:hypothetical protein